MNARVYVGILLILIGVICLPSLTSQAQNLSAGWAGATAWCWKIGNGVKEGIAHGSVGWGNMANRGLWQTSATIMLAGGGFMHTSRTGSVEGDGGGVSHLAKRGVDSGSAYSYISCWDHGGKHHFDSNTDWM